MPSTKKGEVEFDVSISVETDPSPAYEGSTGIFKLTVTNEGPGVAPAKFAGAGAIPIVDTGAYVYFTELPIEVTPVKPEGLFDPCHLLMAQSRGAFVGFGFRIPELKPRQTQVCEYEFRVLPGLTPEFDLLVFLEHQDDTNPSNDNVVVSFGGFEPQTVPTLDFGGSMLMALLLVCASLLWRWKK